MKAFVDQYGQKDDGKIGIVEVRDMFLIEFGQMVFTLWPYSIR